MKDYGIYEVLGKTRDDAAGEAFDKVARVLGLGYPGGPQIDKISKEGNPDAISFPKAYLEEVSYDFSFSGLKSAVLNYLNTQKMKGLNISVPDVAAGFQKSVVKILVEKTIKCALKKKINRIVLAGGVAANSSLRKCLKAECEKNNIDLKYPSLHLCTDNAAMIGCLAYYNYIKGLRSTLDLNAVANLKIESYC